jgi:DNA polymerase III alpha subunit
MMLMALVESARFDFRLVLFSRDYETYVSKIEEDRIIIVEGRVRFDTERDEISVSPGAGFGKKSAGKDAIKSFSISQFRDFVGVKDPKVKSRNGESTPTDESSEGSVQYDIQDNSNYYIDIPPYWTKDDLLDLKDHLASLPV